MQRVELAVRGVVGAHLSDRLLCTRLHIALISSLFSHLIARPHLGLCDSSGHLICWGESLLRLAHRPGALLHHFCDGTCGLAGAALRTWGGEAAVFAAHPFECCVYSRIPSPIRHLQTIEVAGVKGRGERLPVLVVEVVRRLACELHVLLGGACRTPEAARSRGSDTVIVQGFSRGASRVSSSAWKPQSTIVSIYLSIWAEPDSVAFVLCKAGW